ncbi:MAG: putative M18 family aminopeptidase 1 [Firmicutes bacterium ADurb.Bin193]|nr:MAG: putative M18 family aminopeptidase 1 [Firmicutes bacterium ADurb.Bin193]
MEIKYKVKNCWEAAGDSDKSEVTPFCEGYKNFMDNAKTEREAASLAVMLAEQKGFRDIDSVTALKKGDKIYIKNRGKSVMLAVMGEDSLKGFNIVAAHIDAPRIDLKQNPLYEDLELAFFKTHYYGGIKKYQWLAIPLSIHGVIVLGDGTKVNVIVGEDDSDPVFCITDLLPHLAQEQMGKKMSEAVTGEGLNLLVGSIPGKDEKDKVKGAVLELLHDKYGICEEDFISAELEIVPSSKARDLGFDRSMIAAYGQDDRVCAYTALAGILETENPSKTAICMLADKEEIGSMGNTGMKSRFFEDSVAKIISLEKAAKGEAYNDLMIRQAFASSFCLSADVGAAVDPNYKDVSELSNAPRINGGVMITKYTGSKGKANSSDASAELVGRIRKLFNDNKIIWQIGELGKVDQGGGGTVAQDLANLNIETVDCGVPLLSMHSPMEISGKMDVYMAYKAYKAFYSSI